MESDIEEGLIQGQETSRYTVAIGCVGISLVAIGLLVFILYMHDMFSKKIWI